MNVGSREIARTMIALRKPVPSGTYYPWESQLQLNERKLWIIIAKRVGDVLADIKGFDEKREATTRMRKLLGWLFAPLYFAYAQKGEKLSSSLASAALYLEGLFENGDHDREQSVPFFGALQRMSPRWEHIVYNELKKFSNYRFSYYYMDIATAILECVHTAEKQAARKQNPTPVVAAAPTENPIDSNHPDHWMLEL